MPNSLADPNMSFLEKTRPGPKSGQKRPPTAQGNYQSPMAGKPPNKSPDAGLSEDKTIGQQVADVARFASTPDKSNIMPTVQMQRSHMNQFLDTLISKHNKKRTELESAQPYSVEEQKQLAAGSLVNKRGIGYLLEQVTDVSQIIPDERPADDPNVQ